MYNGMMTKKAQLADLVELRCEKVVPPGIEPGSTV
jgi:hypothetical protein